MGPPGWGMPPPGMGMPPMGDPGNQGPNQGDGSGHVGMQQPMQLPSPKDSEVSKKSLGSFEAALVVDCAPVKTAQQSINHLKPFFLTY